MKTAVVTGAARGLGREIAFDLLRRGWKLVVVVRSGTPLDDLREFAAATGVSEPDVFDCDLSDHSAVLAACDLLRGGPRLDLVINNAGIGGGVDPTVREVNSFGVELRMAVNAVTPHLIARELAGVLTTDGRIVQVGSVGQAPLDLEDLGFLIRYDGVQAYCRSKLALIMSAMELAKAGVPVNVVHPANQMPTRMVRESGLASETTLDDGVLAVLRVALDTDLRGVAGAYFDRFDRAAPHEQAFDASARSVVVDWLDDAAARARL